MRRLRNCVLNAFLSLFVILIAIHCCLLMYKSTTRSTTKFAKAEPNSSNLHYGKQEHQSDITRSLNNSIRPRRNIWFLKTHKCASSTVQNILMRFGLRHSLNFAIPKKNNYLGYFESFSESLLAPETKTKDGKYNILTHHTRYNSLMRNFMPADTAIVTILREPAAVFESVFNYYKLQNKYQITFQNLLQSLSNVSAFEVIEKKLANRRHKHGCNQMSRDLGLSETLFQNITEINEFIKKIEREFDYVMLAEYMDESLVLLANLMRWPLHYVSYLPLNARPSENKYHLSGTEQLKLARLNNADTLLYEYFLNKFEDATLRYGTELLLRGVGELRRLNRKLKQKCVAKRNRHGYAKTINYELKNPSDWDCVYSTKLELAFTRELRNVQTNRMRLTRKLTSR